MEYFIVAMLLYISSTVFALGEYKRVHPENKFPSMIWIPVVNICSVLLEQKRSISQPIWSVVFLGAYMLSMGLADVLLNEAKSLVILSFIIISALIYVVRSYLFTRTYIKALGDDFMSVLYFSLFAFMGLTYYGITLIVSKKKRVKVTKYFEDKDADKALKAEIKALQKERGISKADAVKELKAAALAIETTNNEQNKQEDNKNEEPTE